MSGHSKWSTIKRAKAATDSKRGNAFTKVSRLISLAAREGGDPESNNKLRMALEKAKEVNMPKDTISKAIKRGTGEDKTGAVIEENVYEGYGPNSVPMIIETITDNSNQTVSDVKHLLTSNGGKLAGQGSVSWMFDKKGVVYLDLPSEDSKKEEIELAAIDAGALDVIEAEDHIEIHTDGPNLESIKEEIGKITSIVSSGIELLPQNPMDVDEKDQEKIQRLVEALEEHEDVKSVYTSIG